MKRIKAVLYSGFALCLAGIILYSGYQILNTTADYESEAELHGSLMRFKPGEEGESAEEVVNQSVIDLRERYPDVAGWLSIPDTGVDYPFVWYKDNDYYLRRDLDGNYLFAGTLFMDYRCEKDFSSQNTIIYGHHMLNDSMFGTLQSFNMKSFFDAAEYGTIYLPHATLTLQFFAYMVLNPDTEKEIYNTTLSGTYHEYVKANARHYRDIGLTDSDRIVTLSTCAYEFNNARMILLARVT